MSILLFTSVKATVEFKENTIERRLDERTFHSETINKRFEGTIEISFQSSGDLSGWTKEEIANRITEALITEHILL